MSIEDHKRDRNNLAIVAVNKDNINSHRAYLRQKNLVEKHIKQQDSEIRFLKNEILQMKKIISNLLQSK